MSEPKICPYRKRLHLLEGIEGDPTKRLIWDEAFSPCLEDRCAMWRWVKHEQKKGGALYLEGGHCGLAGKP